MLRLPARTPASRKNSMHPFRLLGPLAILVSGLLLAASDLPSPDAATTALTLGAAGFLLLLLLWRGAPSWLRPAMPAPGMAQRVTIRIRCSR
jgi:hypothetical protein